MYTPGDISKLLDVPPTTIRRWAGRFAPFLSPSAQGAGKKRRYTQQDLDLLAHVRDLSAQNVNLDNIATQLENLVDIPPATAGPDPSTAITTLPGVLKEFTRIAEQLRQMEQDRQQDREQLARLQDQVQQLSEELAQARRPLLDKIRSRFARRPPADGE